MNSSSIGSGAAPAGVPVKTEYSNNVSAPAQQPHIREESFGEKLNRMAGVVEEGKVKFGPKKDDSLSKDAFLKMTMEQIKYQDPMDPVKNEQFTQQMAMLSQLEQQVNMNSTLKSILDNSKNMQIAALQLVGKDVNANNATIYHDDPKLATAFQFSLPASATDLKVEILNDKGEAIDVMDLGAREAGVVSTKWDGILKNDVPAVAGKYSYRIDAKGADGKAVNVPTQVEGRVTGVTTSKGTTYLLVGDQKVSLNDVQTIRESKQTGLSGLGDRNAAGIENVGNSVSGSADVAKTDTAQVEEKHTPQIAVSDDAKTSLAGGSESTSLFPLLYR